MNLVGHRGAKLEYPENTILGFQKAIEAGVKGIELDIHQCASGELVVIHDFTLDRTTDKTGKISELTWQEIQAANAGDGEKVPLLIDALDFCLQRDIQVFIESKVLAIEADLVKATQQFSKSKDLLKVICFDHYFVKNVKELDSGLQTGCLLVGNPIDPVHMVKSANADLLAVNIANCRPNLVEICKSSNVALAVWNANTEDELKTMQDMGLDYIMTDRPEALAKHI